MGLVKTRRLAAMQKQQTAKARIKPPLPLNRNVNEFAQTLKFVLWSQMIETDDNNRSNMYGTR